MTRFHLYWYAAILILAAFLRFWQIGSVPIGITNDEGGSIYSSYSISKTLRSLDGKFLPLTFNLDNSYGPVAIYLDAPFVALFGPNAYGLRLPFAILSLCSVVLIFFLVFELTSHIWVSLSCMLGLAISPWHIHMNHGAYDGPITFLFLLSLYIFIRGVRKGNILWSIPWIALSFYSYHAIKIYWIVYIPLLILIYWSELWQKQKIKLILFVGICVVILASFLYVLKSQSITRQQVLLFPNIQKMSEEVNRERRYSIGPLWFSSMFSNKITNYTGQLLERYAKAFTPQFLFLYGEGGIYGSFHHGVLYLIDIGLLLSGVAYILRRGSVKLNVLLFGSLLLAPLPSTVTIDVSYALRGIFMLPFLMIFWGMGLYQIVSWCYVQKTFFSKCFAVAVFVAYVWSVLGFVHLYFFRYSVSGSEYWFASSRDASELIGLLKRKYKNVYVGQAGKMFMFQYALYNAIALSEVKAAWNTAKAPFIIGNVSILETCIEEQNLEYDPNRDLPPSTLYITRDSCHPYATPSATIRDRSEDLHVIWNIYEKK